MTFRRTRSLAVSEQGAVAGCVLRGDSRSNSGLRIRVLQEQARGHDGAVKGPFVILDVGANPSRPEVTMSPTPRLSVREAAQLFALLIEACLP